MHSDRGRLKNDLRRYHGAEAPRQPYGDDQGFMPLELLLISVGVCSGASLALKGQGVSPAVFESLGG